MPDKEDWLHDSFIRKELLDTDFMEKHRILHCFNTKPAHYYCSLLDAISRGFRYNQEMGFAPGRLFLQLSIAQAMNRSQHAAYAPRFISSLCPELKPAKQYRKGRPNLGSNHTS